MDSLEKLEQLNIELQDINKKLDEDLQQLVLKLQKRIALKFKYILDFNQNRNEENIIKEHSSLWLASQRALHQQPYEAQDEIKTYFPIQRIRKYSLSPEISNLKRYHHYREIDSDLEEHINDKDQIEIFQNELSIWQNQSKQDFQFTNKIGKGGYGTVYRAVKKSTGDIVAIKIIKKEDVLRNGYKDQIKNERLILGHDNQQYLVNGLYTFQGKQHLFFVMEYMGGGHLGSILEAQGRFELNEMKFYAAEIILCLKFLHENNIIHRDLKPENILMTEEGHLKLADFGYSDQWSQGQKQRKFTKYDGTVYYMAPEAILEQEHSFKVDI